jgi:hypothetical protein
MVDLITLSPVKYSDGNIATYQLRFVSNGDLNGYTKAMSITMTAIIIVLQLGACKSRMAHNVLHKFEYKTTKMIKRTEHKRKMYLKSFDAGFKDKSHLEVHLVTTYWLLFMPIYRSIKLLDSNM